MLTLDYTDCFVTPEETLAELENIEAKLASKLGIKENVRQTIIERIRSGELLEDELVADWSDAYSSHLDDLR